MRAVLYDGHTRRAVRASCGPLHLGTLQPARHMTVVCTTDPTLARWDGREDLFLVLGHDPNAIAPADVTSAVLELDGGGTVAIVGFTPEAVEAAAEWLRTEVAYERRLCRRAL